MTTRHRKTAFAVLFPFIVFILSGISGNAQAPPDTPPSATVAEVVREALEKNPDLTAMRREFDAMRARVPQAKALPDPMVMFGNNTQGNALPFAGRDGDFSETYVGVAQELPWFGIRKLRGQIADAEAETKLREYEQATRRLQADVKAALVELVKIDRVLGVVKRDLEILNKIAEVAEARYAVGKAEQTDIINARVEATELLERQTMLEAERETVAAQINAFLLRDPTAPVPEVAEIRAAAEPPPLDELIRSALETAPEVKRFRRMIDAGNHALRLAEKEASSPEFGVNFIYHNRPAFPDYYTYGVTVKVPLQAFSKRRHAVAERTSDLAANRARLTSTETLIRYKLRDAHIKATSAAKLLKLNREGILPQSAVALESALASYQVGKTDFLTVLTALKRAVDVEIRFWELSADHQRALAEMEVFAEVELVR